MPALIVVEPVQVLVPESVSVPAPALVSVPAPATTPAYVSVAPGSVETVAAAVSATPRLGFSVNVPVTRRVAAPIDS